ncbi:CopM family metallochaperone [Shinella sp.]|uniref:CopM family metallochaperone n=1 Tax=Shinella sp. TaxID=1870904 RepID=UPI003F70296D
MKHFTSIFAAAVAAVSLSNVAFAQDSEAFKLPEQCSTANGGAMGHMSGGSTEGGMDAMMGMENMDMDSMPEHVRENMQKMMQTMPAMHEGMMNENPNVAFACGMIAHHQGAIDMAEVMLEHGDDEELRTLAETIIEAQKAEIEDMTTWLAENAN